jgi:AmmeMemoRadiSam system protein B
MWNSPSGEIEKIREPIVEGIFYPDSPDELKKAIENLLAASPVQPENNLAIISPHAGLQYAGSMMAAAFKAAAKREITSVVIMAPTHREIDDDVVFPESAYFRTPLGSIPVAQDLIEELLSCSTLFLRNDIPHMEEHCIEVLLPFMQVLFPQAQLVPILLNKKNLKNIKALANALQLIFSNTCDKVLFVVSSNMAFNLKEKAAEEEARHFIELIVTQKEKEILNGLVKKEITACGANAVAALLAFLKKKYKTKILEQGHSHQTKPSSSSIVHYAAIALSPE